MSNKIKIPIFLFGALVVIYLIFWIIAPDRFGGINSMYILLQQCLVYAVAGCGCYFIIAMGVFDFSVGAIMVMSALIGCQLSHVCGYLGLFIGAIVTGAVMGALNGIIYIKLRIPSIIVTVGLAIIYECIAFILAGDQINRLDSNMKLFGRSPYNFILAVITFLFAVFIINKTKMGTYIRSIGKNESFTKNIGINVDRYKFIGFALCGLFAGIAALIMISRNGSIVPSTGMSTMSRNFQPFMGCFVGVAFKRYINPVISIVVSEFMISMIVSGVTAIGLDSTLQNCIIGIILLIIVVAMAREQRKSGEVVR